MAPEDDEDFFVRSRMEVLALLRGIMDSHSLVTAYFDHGKGSIITAILGLLEDRNALILDYGADERLNQRLLNSDKVFFDTAYNKVQIKFSASSLKRVRYDDRDALMMEIPDDVQRIQRREYYRIETPVVDPVRCLIESVEEEGGKKVDLGGQAFADGTIVNISIGGVCIIDFPSGVNVEKGMVFKGCHIELPGVGSLDADIKVVNAYELPVKEGGRVTHYGCQFLNLNGGMQSMIQRYVFQLERERRAKFL